MLNEAAKKLAQREARRALADMQARKALEAGASIDELVEQAWDWVRAVVINSDSTEAYASDMERYTGAVLTNMLDQLDQSI